MTDHSTGQPMYSPMTAEATNDDALAAGKITLGAELRARREGADLRLRDIADALGVTVAHVSDVERGRRTPSLDLLYAWATLLGTTMRALIRGLYPWDGGEPPSADLPPPPDGRRKS